MSRADRRRLQEIDVDKSDIDEQRDWDESGRDEHRPIPIDAPEADALDQERGAPVNDEDRR